MKGQKITPYICLIIGFISIYFTVTNIELFRTNNTDNELLKAALISITMIALFFFGYTVFDNAPSAIQAEEPKTIAKAKEDAEDGSKPSGNDTIDGDNITSISLEGSTVLKIGDHHINGSKDLETEIPSVSQPQKKPISTNVR